MEVDLATLWKQLGIESDGKTVRLIEDAPLAAIRRSITNPAAATAPEKTGQPSAAVLPSAVFAGRTASTSKLR